MRLRNAARPEFFEREGFEGAAGKVTGRSDVEGSIIGDLKGEVDVTTLLRGPKGVKVIAVIADGGGQRGAGMRL